MKASLIIASHHLRRLLHKPKLVVFLAAIPIALTFVESAAMGPSSGGGPMPPTPVLFVDQDNSPASRALEACFTSGIGKDPVAVTHLYSLDAGKKTLQQGREAALFVAPVGFGSSLTAGRAAEIAYYPRATGDIDARIADAVLGSCIALANKVVTNRNAASLTTIANASQSIDLQREVPPASSNVESLYARILPGLTVFGLLAISQAMAGFLLRDRTRAVQWRILSAPVSVWSVLFGSLLFLVIGLTGLFMLIGLLSVAVFRIHLQNAPALVVLGIGFAAFLAAFQLLISAWTRSDRGAQSISTASVMLLSLFGGAFIPTENYPGPLRVLAYLLPTGATQAGLARALTSTVTFSAGGLQMCTIWAWASGLSILALIAQRRKLQQ